MFLVSEIFILVSQYPEHGHLFIKKKVPMSGSKKNTASFGSPGHVKLIHAIYAWADLDKFVCSYVNQFPNNPSYIGPHCGIIGSWNGNTKFYKNRKGAISQNLKKNMIQCTCHLILPTKKSNPIRSCACVQAAKNLGAQHFTLNWPRRLCVRHSRWRCNA